jgi:hypothetical protein
MAAFAKSLGGGSDEAAYSLTRRSQFVPGATEDAQRKTGLVADFSKSLGSIHRTYQGQLSQNCSRHYQKSGVYGS